MKRRPPLKRRPARSGRKGDPAKAVLASSRARYAVAATRVVCPLQFYAHIQADPSIVDRKTCWGADYRFQLSIFHVVNMAACRSVLWVGVGQGGGRRGATYLNAVVGWGKGPAASL
jgi:hypothetical protein